MIRYTYYLDEGNIVNQKDDDVDFMNFAKKMHDLGFVFIEGEKEFYVNPDKIKCVMRETVDEQEVKDIPAEAKQEA